MKRFPIILRTSPLLLVGVLIHAQGNGAIKKRDSAESHTAPTIVAPESNKIFQKQEAKDPITFKWTAVLPSPADTDVVYHLKIWQVAKGQTAMQATKASPPVVKKDINNATETAVTNRSFPRGPNNTFAWTVQATDKQGKAYGVTPPGTFIIQSADITITNFTVRCGGAFGAYAYTLTVTNFGTNPFSITSLVFSGVSISGVTYSQIPAGTIVNPGSGNAFTFTGVFNYTGPYSATIYATVSGNQVGNPNLPSSDTDLATLDACVCSACDRVQWRPGVPTQTLQGNSISITQPFNVTGLGNIVAVKAEIISFARYVDDNCMSCDKDWNEWGNFTTGTFANVPGSLGTAVSPVSGNTHHSMYWSSVGGFSPNSSFNLSISTPPLTALSCCCDRVSLAIRYTYTFRNPRSGICTVCSVVRNYGLHKGTCSRDQIDSSLR